MVSLIDARSFIDSMQQKQPAEVKCSLNKLEPRKKLHLADQEKL